jgi:tyrosyl-tRNA synthetase
MSPIEALLHGVVDYTSAGEFGKKLDRGTPLRVKYGIDPTSTDVHLGHTVPLRKLRHFQILGHTAVVIIGDYTARIGDPTGRNEMRPRLTATQIEHNALNYLDQIGKVIDLSRSEVRYNSDWYNNFSGNDFIDLMAKVTTQQLMARADFAKRLKDGVPIYHHELLYPLLQAHDSVRVEADVELGGTEQNFNLMLGRELQEKNGQEPQTCLMMPILRGLDGTRKMGKSLDNYISIRDTAEEMYGKVMSIPDELMPEWFKLLTDDEMSTTSHPMEQKRFLAIMISTQYHTADAVGEAGRAWDRRFSQRKDPEAIPVIIVPAEMISEGHVAITHLIRHAGFAPSTSQARQLMREGAVTTGPEDAKIKHLDPAVRLQIEDGMILRVGKRHIAILRAERT